MSSLPDRILVGREPAPQRRAGVPVRSTGNGAAPPTVPPAPQSGLLRPRSPDIAALGGANLMVGLLALAGAWVVPALQDNASLRWRILGLGLMLALVGAGLLLRHDWARSASLGMLAYGIVALFTQGWLQEDVAAAFFEALLGHPLTMSAPPPVVANGDDAGMGWSLVLCLAMGWYLVRLAGPKVRAEFCAPRQ